MQSVADPLFWNSVVVAYNLQVALLLQRGRAMLSPSVVSLNKIITRAESFIIFT